MSRKPLPLALGRARHAVTAAVLTVAAFAGCDNPHAPEQPPPVASVHVSEAALLVLVGADHQLSAILKAADGRILAGRPIVWSSSDTAVAKVTAAGLVAGRAAGSATVTATSEGRNGTALVTVRAESPVPQLESLSPGATPASQSNLTLAILGAGFAPDARVYLNGVLRPSTYVSATELRAQLTSVDIGAPGTFEVTVRNLPPGGGVSNPLPFTVTPAAPPVAFVDVSPVSPVDLAEGEVRQFSATPRAVDGTPLPGRAITWHSTDPLVASVDAAGRVTAHREGVAMIVATSEGRTGSATVRVIAFRLFYLESAAGSALPAELHSSTYVDERGHHVVRTLVGGGMMRIEAGHYEQRLTLHVYVDDVLTPTPIYNDHGTVWYDWPSGDLIFLSGLYQNVQFRGTYSADGRHLTTSQVVMGEGPARTFVYGRQ